MSNERRRRAFLVTQGSKHFKLVSIGEGSQPVIWGRGEFYEKRLLVTLARMKRKGIYVDAGANLGNHSVFFWNFCPATKIVAIEPFTETLEALKLNLKRHVGRYELVQCAVGAEAGRVAMRLTDKTCLGSAQVVANREGAIEMRTLDAILKKSSNVAVLKIDVEGHELDALKGATSVITRSKPVIVAECKRDDEFSGINEFLKGFKYHTDGVNYCASRTCIWEPKK